MKPKSRDWVSHRTMKITRTGVTRQSHTKCKSTQCTERALRCGGDRSAQVKKMLNNSKMLKTQRCTALGRIEMTSLVSTSRYWVWSPMSGIYATMESARVCCHSTRTNGPLSDTGYAVAVTHTNGPPTYAYIPGHAI